MSDIKPDTIEETELDPKWFVDRSTGIYGGSGAGKTWTTKTIIQAIRAFVTQIIVFCPTDAQNGAFSKVMVPSVLVHGNPTENVLRKVWQRQEVLAALYRRANQEPILESLFNKINDPDLLAIINCVKTKHERFLDEIRRQYLDKEVRRQKSEEGSKKFLELINMLYKRSILINRHKLAGMQLTDDESCALEYIDLNPKLVIVFDDCTAELDKMSRNVVLRNYFLKGRWQFITILVTIHQHTAFKSDIRMNLHNLIFCDSQNLVGLMNNKTNGYIAEVKRATLVAVDKMDEDKKHNKLMFFKDNNVFKMFKLRDLEDKPFYNGYMKLFCEKLCAKGIMISHDNPFVRHFSIGGRR